MSSLFVLPAAFGLIACTASWIVRGRRWRISLYDETPFGLSSAQYSRQQTRRRFYARSAWAGFDSLAGATLGWFLAVALLPTW